MRKAIRFLSLLLLCICIGGCAAQRPISDSGYPGDRRTGNPYYAGELNELDVLGMTDAQTITDSDIKRTIETRRAVKARKGSSIIVIQSGALAPDDSMIEALSKHFTVVPFSGIPAKDQTAYSKKLRLTAAQGGYSHILCFWGTLESAVEDKETKAISWVPIAGLFLPDEVQKMRIRLRAALIDVPTGQWSMIIPEPVDDSASSSAASRVRKDQKQVEQLKQKGYGALVSELARYFSS
jgi:hypothetical protein